MPSPISTARQLPLKIRRSFEYCGRNDYGSGVATDNYWLLQSLQIRFGGDESEGVPACAGDDFLEHLAGLGSLPEYQVIVGHAVSLRRDLRRIGARCIKQRFRLLDALVHQ